MVLAYYLDWFWFGLFGVLDAMPGVIFRGLLVMEPVMDTQSHRPFGISTSFLSLLHQLLLMSSKTRKEGLVSSCHVIDESISH
jgi:hypothetical protein